MENAKHDTDTYEGALQGRNGYKRDIFDGNALYDAFLKSRKGSAWKPQVQSFRMNLLTELASLQNDLKNRTYKFSSASEFILRERGKTRLVIGEQIRDRVAEHSLCDEYLTPLTLPKLIYDNGASIKGKGIDFTRKRLLTHLRRYYHTYKTNEGYILLIDFSKYYDNVRHDKLKKLYRNILSEAEYAMWFLDLVLDNSKVDVSYMSDEEYLHCMDTIFNSIEYYNTVSKELLTGEKFMHKHLNIGGQPSQISSLLYSSPFDHYVKVVKSEKFYGRYMDDCYIIHRVKEHLIELLYELIEEAERDGIKISMNKTRIVPLSSYWRYLQVQYSLTETGRIIMKINPKRITIMRRKMKVLSTRMTYEEFHNWFYSWYNNYSKLMSRKQKENILKLFKEVSPCIE